MVQKQPKKEPASNTPYYYPTYSRYNYPPKFGTEDEDFAEPTFQFPSWDDGLSSYTRRTHSRKNSYRYEDFDIGIDEDEPIFDVKEDNNNNNNNNNYTYNDAYRMGGPEEEEKEDGLTKCDELHDSINSAKHDAQADYDRFKSQFSSMSDELLALQQAIEATERRYLSRKWGTDDELGSEANSFSESSILISGVGVGPSPHRSLTSSPTLPASSEVPAGGFGSGSRRVLLSSPSAMQAATSPYRKRSASMKSAYEEDEYDDDDDDCLNNPGSPNGRRCMGLEDGWTQERVHQNEWIRC